MTGNRTTLDQLEGRDAFIRRHVGPSTDEVDAMLVALGHSDLDGLIDAAVPEEIRSREPLDLPAPCDEAAALARLRALATRNTPMTSLIGMGYHGTITPSVIQRNVLENPGWYTAYTPYQAEVSQGRLEVLLTFQQMVCDLTGMDLANASLLDEATAAAEAMAMARRVSRGKSDRFLVDSDCHPQTRAVIETRARTLGLTVAVVDAWDAGVITDAFGVLVQYPGSSGQVRDPEPVLRAARAAGVISVVATDPLALTLLRSPGEMGADIVVGSAQRFGVPMGFGGPHAAFFATRDAHKRTMPGRIIGVSVDAHGQPAYRLALQTREQHIRREKSTSNICTAQVLLAMIAALYAVYHGPEGLRRIAMRTHRLTAVLAAGLRALGLTVVHEAVFDTLTVDIGGPAEAVHARARASGFNLRPVDDRRVGVSLDELSGRETVEALWRVFAPEGDGPCVRALDRATDDAVPASLARGMDYLSHPVFHAYRSETEMMRYLRRLAAKDIALDRAMIPLGSCTMKLNAATEMAPVSWPEFAAPHPFAPTDQVAGYRALIGDLERWLCVVTGFDAISMQPNAGSQGEYTGLLVIREYLAAQGEGHRDVCLIPSSAHGTNPASAVMAGLRVVVVDCDEEGNVDLADLEAKAAAHAGSLAALMLTYPSTHGVFETAVKRICQVVHDHGGQVYMDGANLNALVGLVLPAELGADVSHLNLHKTFCIPHGGGGPGMGPIGVKAHLAPFLPRHPLVEGVNPAATAGSPLNAVSAAPWGSPLILPITWAYVAMMGPEGLTRATKIAILNANYMAKRLGAHYPVLYTGPDGLVAHECIIDLRDIKARTGIGVEDVAKRLMDHGFHAPTMSWPVPETLMIEPTESESQAEIDRFCAAMIAIREEIAAVERGEIAVENSPPRNAPHSAALLAAGAWPFAYDRATAFFPGGAATHADKYWPPVGRVDNVHGDRHLVCTCPPLDAYREAAE